MTPKEKYKGIQGLYKPKKKPHLPKLFLKPKQPQGTRRLIERFLKDFYGGYRARDSRTIQVERTIEGDTYGLYIVQAQSDLFGVVGRDMIGRVNVSRFDIEEKPDYGPNRDADYEVTASVVRNEMSVLNFETTRDRANLEHKLGHSGDLRDLRLEMNQRHRDFMHSWYETGIRRTMSMIRSDAFRRAR